MSSGEYWEAAYSGQTLDGHILEAVDELKGDPNPLWRAFAAHLELVSEAVYRLACIKDGDSAPGCEVAAIEAVLQTPATRIELEELIRSAEALALKMTEATRMARFQALE